MIRRLLRFLVFGVCVLINGQSLFAAEASQAAGARQTLTWANDALKLQWRLGSDSVRLTNLHDNTVVSIPIGLDSLGFGDARLDHLCVKPVRVTVTETDKGSEWRFVLPEVAPPNAPLAARQTVGFELNRASPWVRKRVTVELAAGAKAPETKTRTGAPRGGQTSCLLTDVNVERLQLTGRQPRQPFDGWQSYPVLAQSFFCGVEFPVAKAVVNGEQARLSYQPGRRLSPGDRYDVWPIVYGASAPGKSRQAFETYIRSLRPPSGLIHIQYNSWWSAPYPFTEKHMLDLIDVFYEKFYKANGARLDTFCLDMGWTDRRTIWRIDEYNFPLGFSNLAWALKRMESRLGLWCSPSSCYPDAQDLDRAENNGYETFAYPKSQRFGCLGGPRYQGAFRDSLVDLTRRYGISHIKYDGYRPECPEKGHGHEPGDLSREKVALGLIDIFKAVHAANPDSWFEPTCFGFRPSPWWLPYVNTVIGTFGDDAPLGRVPCPLYRESYTTARDFFNLQGTKDILFPVCAQEVLGIIHQTAEPLQNDAVVTVLRGHSFLPLYVNPKFMDDRRWRFLARLCNWARSNAELLTYTNALCFGGWADDQKSRSWERELPRDPYGYAHFMPDRGLLMLRNPWIKPTQVQLALDESIGFPKTLKDVAPICIYPDYNRAGAPVGYGSRLDVQLRPYETRLLAFGGYPNAPTEVKRPSPTAPTTVQTQVEKGRGSLRLAFETAGGKQTRQLWVLYESPTPLLTPDCRVQINGNDVKPRVHDSQTGWRATGHKEPEFWNWLLADLPAGDCTVTADLELMDGAKVSAWLVTSEPVADDPRPARPIPPPETLLTDAVELLAPTSPESAGMPSLVNLALAKKGAKATASSNWADEHNASKAIDGDLTTRWNSKGDDRVGAWLEVELPAPKRISQVLVREACGGRITQYKIQVWTGSEWRDVATASKEAARVNIRHRFEPVETAKVRLVTLAATEVPSVFEFEVHGQP